MVLMCYCICYRHLQCASCLLCVKQTRLSLFFFFFFLLFEHFRIRTSAHKALFTESTVAMSPSAPRVMNQYIVYMNSGGSKEPCLTTRWDTSNSISGDTTTYLRR